MKHSMIANEIQIHDNNTNFEKGMDHNCKFSGEVLKVHCFSDQCLTYFKSLGYELISYIP